MLIQLGQAREYLLASLALEVVTPQMFRERSLVWAVKVAARLQAVFVPW